MTHKKCHMVYQASKNVNKIILGKVTKYVTK